jgi:hypothetical protein
MVFLARRRGLPVFPRAKPCCKGFIHIGGEAAHHNPLNPLNLLNPLNPSREAAPMGVPLKISYESKS